MRNKVFTAGVAVMAIVGAVITFAAYTLERLESERRETERRIQQLRKVRKGEKCTSVK